MKQYFFSIIIIHLNEGYLLNIMLDSIERNFQYEEYEIILVDDGSDDRENALGFISTHPLKDKIRVFFEKNLWVCGARNFWARQAKWEYLLFFDSHMYFVDDFLWKLNILVNEYYPIIDFLQPSVGWFSFKWFPESFYFIDNFLLNASWKRLDHFFEKKYRLIETPNIVGCACIAKKSTYDFLGTFHPFFIQRWVEDLEFSLRAWLAWFRCWLVPELRVCHYFKKYFQNTEVKHEHVLNNKILFAQTCFTPSFQEKIFHKLQHHYGEVMYREVFKRIQENPAIFEWIQKTQEKFIYTVDRYFYTFREYYASTCWLSWNQK